MNGMAIHRFGRRLAVLCAAILLAPPALARSEGDFVFQFGWLHARPQTDNGAPLNRLRPNPAFPVLGIEERFRSENVTLSAPNSDTLGLILKYFASDHWALKLQAGIPPKAGIHGEGVIKPTGPTGEISRIDLGKPRFNPLGRARQWSPVLMLEYHFRDPGAVVRPYVGLGTTFTWFTEVDLNGNFEDTINRRFGAPLASAAGRPGPTHTHVDAASVWEPALEVGVGMAVSERWSATLSMVYIPLTTTTTVTLDADDGTRLAESRTRISADPLVFGVLAGYRF